MSKQNSTLFLNSKLKLLFLHLISSFMPFALKAAEPVVRSLSLLRALPAMFFIASVMTAFSHKLMPFTPPPINFFIAPLLVSLRRLGLFKTLWLALFCGIYIDLLSLFNSVGVSSFAFICSLYVCCRIRQYMSEGWLLTALQAFLFASTTSCIFSLSLWHHGLFRQLHMRSYIEGELFCIACEGCLAVICLLLLKRIDGMKERSGEDFFASL